MPFLCRATIIFFRSSESSLPWGVILNFQWPVWESESDNIKFNTPAPHSHLRPCNSFLSRESKGAMELGNDGAQERWRTSESKWHNVRSLISGNWGYVSNQKIPFRIFTSRCVWGTHPIMPCYEQIQDILLCELSLGALPRIRKNLSTLC